MLTVNIIVIYVLLIVDIYVIIKVKEGDLLFYDGTKLLSLSDISGNKPEIYISTSNRSAGKTTFFNRMVVKKFLNGQGKFGLLYRFNYELDNVADKFFKEIQTLFFNEYEMTTKKRAKGIYHELFLNDKPCGYAMALNNADQIKKMSHLFSDINRMIFDEFQSECNHYCNDEVNKFVSIHNSVARGKGKQSRYVPVYMLGNFVTLLNPYYTALGISNRLTNDTNFLRGEGYVLEQGFNESASKNLKNSAFNKAFQSLSYVDYTTEKVYLNDSDAFIEKLSGKSRYLCNIKYKNKLYAIKEFQELGVIYCTSKVDEGFPNKLAVTTEDHNINYVMLRNHDFFINNLRYLFERGCFRFQNLECKTAILSALSY